MCNKEYVEEKEQSVAVPENVVKPPPVKHTLYSVNSSLQTRKNTNASQYTGNKQIYIHSLYINTKTCQQLKVLHYKYNYISTNQLHVYTKRKREGHTNQNIVFFLFQTIS